MTAWPETLYWTTLLLFTGGSLALVVLAWTRKALWIMVAATVFLIAGLIVAALPSPSALPPIAVLLTLAGIALGVAGGGPAATACLRLATRNGVAEGEHGGILIDSEQHEVLRGGVTIGILERLAVTGSLIAGFPAALAVIIAIKGVGRFSELDAAEVRERFIIGTFVSLIWACACAALVVLAVG